MLRNTRGLEDYSTAKECKAKKVRGKIFLFCQSMDAFEYVDYVRQCIHPLTKNDATIVFSLQGGGVRIFRSTPLCPHIFLQLQCGSAATLQLDNFLNSWQDRFELILLK